MNQQETRKTELPPPRRVLVAGCGFVGLEVARLFHAQGVDVTGLTHSEESAHALQSEPFRVTACDINDRPALAALAASGPFEAVVDCVSSGRSGAEVYRRVFLEGAQSLLETFRPARFLFTSSTSVYAQKDGSLVTEESAAEPERETAQILCATEERVLAAGGIVARLAGIYGPGRWMLREKFLNGSAILEGEGSRVLNHIHRDDAAAAILFLLTRPASLVAPGIYNVADNTPLPQREAYTLLARYYQRPPVPVGSPDLHRKRAWTSKQVSNAKLRALGWSPRFPSIRDALAIQS